MLRRATLVKCRYPIAESIDDDVEDAGLAFQIGDPGALPAELGRQGLQHIDVIPELSHYAGILGK